MKRFLKALTTLSLTIALLIVFASCGSNKFYKEWSEAGANIEKEHIFEVVELEDVKTKIANGDTFVLIYAASTNNSAVSAISSFQAQYDYLCTNGEEIVVYVLDSTEYDKSSERTEVKKALGVTKELPKNGAPLVVTYIKGVTDVESNWVDKIQTEQFIVNGSLDYSSLCSYIYRELLAE